MFVITYARGSKADVDGQQERLVQSLPPEDTVVGSYSDLAIGTDTARPELAAVMERLAAGGVQALCVSSLDRLTRRADQLAAIEQVRYESGWVIREVPDIPDGR